MDSNDLELWQPSATLDNLRIRAEVLRQIREFFWQRGVTEVDTPNLMDATVTDPYMVPLTVTMSQQKYFLQTSPEFAMKRLLAAGMGDIYQLGKNFRSDEVGRKHQPEFTLLEWYRIDWDHHQLMDEVYQLIEQICGSHSRVDLSYQAVFSQYLRIDPININERELSEIAEKELGNIPDDLSRDDYLSLLFAERIEPQLPQNVVTFITDFPASQASLAKLNVRDKTTSARFEAYFGGLELANGFWELTNVDEQRKRFHLDNQQRMQKDWPTVDVDEQFLAALAYGLPNCSGVALGVDRLLMLQRNASHINEVLPFPITRG